MREMLRFEREVQLNSRLNHPNTITTFDFGRTPIGVFYYALEYLPGITLDRLVANFGPLPEGRVIPILHQIAAALQEAHAVGLIQRDFKPANLMVYERGGLFDFVKVLDFGLVREAQRTDPALTLAGSITGTPQYLACEPIHNPIVADARSDLYALGAVAYYLLTGRHTFTGTSIMDVLTQSLNREPEPPSRALGKPVDPALEQLILACLSKSPTARPADATQFLEMLARCQSFGTWTNDHARAWWAAHQPVKSAPTSSSATCTTAAGHPGLLPTVPLTLQRVDPTLN